MDGGDRGLGWCDVCIWGDESRDSLDWGDGGLRRGDTDMDGGGGGYMGDECLCGGNRGRSDGSCDWGSRDGMSTLLLLDVVGSSDGAGAGSSDVAWSNDFAGALDDRADTQGNVTSTPGDDTDTPSDGPSTPGDDRDSPALRGNVGRIPVSWVFRPPGSLCSEIGSNSHNSHNSRRKPAGSLICRSCSKFAQMRRWICSRGSNLSYAWNTLFSSNHIVPSEKLGFSTSNSDLSTATRSVV